MFEILTFFVLYFLILISILSYGIFFSRIINVPNISNNIGVFGILGMIFFGMSATVFHLFIPIYKEFNFIIIFIGIILSVRYFFYKKIVFNKIDKIFFIFLFLISTLMFYKHHPNEDFGYYHLPYIVNFTQEKIIFGLSNLQLNQGWNSIWLNTKSHFYLPFFNYNSTFILDACFFVIVAQFFLFQIFFSKKNNTFLKYFASFFLLFFIIKFARLNSYGLDVPANYFFIIFLYFLFYFIFFDDREKRYHFISLLILISVFATSLRIINILCFIPVIIYFFYFKLDIIKLIKNKIFIVSFIFGIFWLIQQFIYTSCIFFPSDFSCIETRWFDEKIIENFKTDTGIVNKSYQTYKGGLSRDEYLINFNWVPNWYHRNKIEIFEHITAFSITILIYSIINLFNFSNKNNLIRNLNSYIILFYIYIFLFLIIWFLNAPVIRFGTHYIQLFLFITFYYLFLRFIKFKQQIIAGIFILALTFNVFKNVNRINKEKETDSIFPIIQEVRIRKNNISNIIINVPIKNENLTKSEYCWATPPICKINYPGGIIVEKKLGYFFLYKKS